MESSWQSQEEQRLVKFLKRSKTEYGKETSTDASSVVAMKASLIVISSEGLREDWESRRTSSRCATDAT